MLRPVVLSTLLIALTLGCDKGAAAPQAAAAAGSAARGGGSVVLSDADLYTLAPGLIEDGIAVSGGLRPIETIVIRSRLEGDVLEVPVRDGDRVARGALLARFENTEQDAGLRSAQAEKSAAETEARTAQWNFEQTRDLLRAGAVPERDYRAAEQVAATAAARLAAAEARLRAAELAERDTRVLAPSAGTIERRVIQPGVRALRGSELFTLVRTESLELTAAVPARLASSVRLGQPVRFNADGRAFEGRVARVSPTIDPASQSVTVYVQVPNGDGTLKGNTFATGRIIARAIENQLLVPQPAVRQPAAGGGGQPFVWRVKGGVLERAVVSLGLVDEGRGVVQVLEGLAAGDQVVVGSVGLLGAGMQVQIIGGETRRPAGPR